jgi:predicted pyridoxine 5'-phosphate oxidase superfamily flavin-nucleotide-binding protein
VTDLPFHDGELTAQMRFNENWDEGRAHKLGRIIGNSLDERMAWFIESLPFFFLATSDKQGHCDCSFKGSEPGPDGRPLPVALVTGPQQLLLPDFSGNRMFNSLGNILVNPHVGMIFIDFASQTRLRVNGAAAILEDENGSVWHSRWPQAQRAVEVTVEQVYWNCSKRIPQHP